MSTLFEYSSQDKEIKDGLFLERLETFMDKCLADIRAFSERELRSYDETRRSIAEWHAKYLFQPSATTATPSLGVDRRIRVRSTLCNASRILESLFETSGVQSFLLAIDPQDSFDTGFLGGSVQGREFWRGMRGGGESGAKAFKLHCINDRKDTSSLTMTTGDVKQTTIPHSKPLIPPVSGKGGPSRSLKTELYETVRKALRSTSGIRTAEMKWTNPERLDVYRVRVTGWPPGIPAQNPSSLKASQNKQLLESFQSGATKFERLSSARPADGLRTPVEAGSDENDDFSWAYDVDAPTPVVSLPACRSSPALAGPQTLPRPNSSTWNMAVSSFSDAAPLQASLLDDWTQFSELSPSSSDPVNLDWDDDVHRYKKRPRSEEPSSDHGLRECDDSVRVSPHGESPSTQIDWVNVYSGRTG